MKPNNLSNIYEFLETSGLLETGTPEEITAARAQYWKNHRAAFRRQQRQERKEYNIAFQKSDSTLLRNAAKYHHLSETEFIRKATISYIKHERVPINEECLIEIHQILVMIYTHVQILEEAYTDRSRSHLLKQFETLEKQIRAKLFNPSNNDH